LWVRRQYSTCRLYDVSGKKLIMGDLSATGGQPFKNGLRQKPHICMEPGDEVEEYILSQGFIPDADTV
jgi:hypothetical protein